MPRPVYSTQLLCAAPVLPNTFVTCPTGVVMVVRDIDAHETTGSIGATLLLQSPAGGPFWAASRHTSAADELWQWRGRQVLVGGETIELVTVSGTWAAWISGYLLSTP